MSPQQWLSFLYLSPPHQSQPFFFITMSSSGYLFCHCFYCRVTIFYFTIINTIYLLSLSSHYYCYNVTTTTTILSYYFLLSSSFHCHCLFFHDNRRQKILTNDIFYLKIFFKPNIKIYFTCEIFNGIKCRIFDAKPNKRILKIWTFNFF